MSPEVMNLLREWVQAEIDAKLAANETGADGYFHGARQVRVEADRAFHKLYGKLNEVEKS